VCYHRAVAPDLAISIIIALSLALWLSVGLVLVALLSWFGW
jgi:uncharacterized protein (DUF2062 family)